MERVGYATDKNQLPKSREGAPQSWTSVIASTLGHRLRYFVSSGQTTPWGDISYDSAPARS